MAITSFRDKNAFLSNFYPSPIKGIDWIDYPTVEHAYQASKTDDLEERKRIAKLSTPGQAKKAGRKVNCLGDWGEIGGGTPVIVVYQAEKRLKAAGVDPGPVDGIVDAQTQTALRQYQTRLGLPPTGVLDAPTRQALGLK